MEKEQRGDDNHPRVALVLSGGSARATAHLGVIDVLEEYNIPIDLIVAASFGSIIGGYYASGFTIQQILQMMKGFNVKTLLDLRKPFFRILNTEKADLIAKKDIGDTTIEELKIPLFILAADIRKEEMVLFEKGNLRKAMLASSTFPGLFEPYHDGERLLIDGGILNKMLVNIAKQKGADMTIYSDACIFTALNKNKLVKKLYELMSNHVVKKRAKLEQKLQKINLRYIIFKAFCIIQDFRIQYEIYKKSPPDFLIEPAVEKIKALQFRKVEQGYQLGREAALRVIEELVIKYRTFSP
jgi:NTE family protein